MLDLTTLFLQPLSHALVDFKGEESILWCVLTLEIDKGVREGLEKECRQKNIVSININSH